MSWTLEQKTAILGRSKEILVTAAAGSGKTAVLVERIIERITALDNPDSISEMVVLTFTNDAASEMKTRISSKLSELIAANPSNRRLHSQLNLVETAHITTIHSFCSRLIRENFQSVAVNPEFRVIQGDEEEMLKRAVLSDLLEQYYAKNDENFIDLAENVCGPKNDAELEKLILRTVNVLLNDPDPEQFAEKLCGISTMENDIDPAQTLWGDIFIRELARNCTRAVSLYQRAYEIASENELSSGAKECLLREKDYVCQIESALGGMWEQIRLVCLQKPNGKLTFPKNIPAETHELIKRLRTQAKKIIEKSCKPFLSLNSECMISDIKKTSGAVISLKTISLDFIERFRLEKQNRGVLTFDDMEHLALKLLSTKDQNNNLVPSEFAIEYGRTIKELMVDEYQDTSRIQDAIFQMLISGGASLFTVGDVKQSIYRFRRAEPSLFMNRRRYSQVCVLNESCQTPTLLENTKAAIVMNRNFRSVPGVTQSVNEVFGKLMNEEFAGMDYTLEEMLIPERSSQNENEERTQFYLLKTPDRKNNGPDKREAEAKFIAQKIKSMLTSGRMIYDKKMNVRRPVVASDFAVLVRKRNKSILPIAAALTEAGIPVSADAGDNIFVTAEINACIAMLSAVDNPWKDVPLVGYLRSPFEGFSADELARIRISKKNVAFYESLKEMSKEDSILGKRCFSVCKKLSDLRDMSEDSEPSLAVSRMLDYSGARAIFGSMPGGSIRRANIDLLESLAADYTAAGGIDLGGFLRKLNNAEESGTELQGISSGDEGVTITTLHKSKGLEYPIVFLAYTNDKFNIEWNKEHVLIHRDAGIGVRVLDQEKGVTRSTAVRDAAIKLEMREQYAEELRLLYVGMTRARDALIITAMVDDPDDFCEKNKTEGNVDELATICETTSNYASWLCAAYWATEKKAFSLQKIDDITVENVYHTEESLKVQPDQMKTEAISRRIGFIYPYQYATEIPALVTASGYSGLISPSADSVEKNILFERKDWGNAEDESDKDNEVYQKINSQDLTAAEQGIAVHLAFQLAQPQKYQTEAMAKYELDRLVKCGVMSERQRKAVKPAMLKAFYDSKIGEMMISDNHYRREFRFSILAPAEMFFEDIPKGENVLLHGVIDLFIELEDGSIAIIDYKTDTIKTGEESLQAEKHKNQMRIYQYALESITGKKVSKKIIWFVKTQTAYQIA